ncbi:MAG TPA: redox-sensing transcriptional repressor Rex [Longimicrobiales bacterium]|nr:redox-sensing transcriptional repressor Rex [Longimicrobiales bacterium]
MSRRVSESTVRRLSYYLRALEALDHAGVATVSSEELAERGGTTAAQVRKDLSQFGSFGKRGLGYAVPDLTATLGGILGLDRRWRVVLVGAGRIGAALFAYPAFAARGYDYVAVLDSDPARIGTCWGRMPIRPVSDLEEVVRELKADLVILAVPAESAQGVAERAVHAGARGLLNFAAVQLRVPPGIPVKDVDLVFELEALSFAITLGESVA